MRVRVSGVLTRTRLSTQSDGLFEEDDAVDRVELGRVQWEIGVIVGDARGWLRDGLGQVVGVDEGVVPWECGQDALEGVRGRGVVAGRAEGGGQEGVPVAQVRRGDRAR